MPSFDIESKVNEVELRNAVDQTNRELGQRFDFKGQDAKVTILDVGDLEIFADDNFKLDQLFDVLVAKMGKRGVDVRSLTRQDTQTISGNKMKQLIKVQNGLPVERSKALIKLLKNSKLKITASIQGEAVRVSGAKRDTLQEAISEIKSKITDIPLQFGNFRD